MNDRGQQLKEYICYAVYKNEKYENEETLNK